VITIAGILKGNISEKKNECINKMDSYETVESDVLGYSTRVIQQTIEKALGLYRFNLHNFIWE